MLVSFTWEKRKVMRLKTWATRLSLQKDKIAVRPFHLPIWFNENENWSKFLIRINYAPCINNSKLSIDIIRFILYFCQLFYHSSYYCCSWSINQLTIKICTSHSQTLQLYFSTLESLHIFAYIIIPHIMKAYIKIIWQDDYLWMEFIVYIYTIYI